MEVCADSGSISLAKMPQTVPRINCKDLLIFVLHSEIARGIFRSFGVCGHGKPSFLEVSLGVSGMLEYRRKLVAGSTIWPIARVVPSFIESPIASYGQVIPTARNRRVYV